MNLPATHGYRSAAAADRYVYGAAARLYLGVVPTSGHICFSRILFFANGNVANVENEPVPVGSVDSDRKAVWLSILVISDSEDLEDLDAAVIGQPEERDFPGIRHPYFYAILVPNLMHAVLAQIGDGAFLD